MPVNVYRLVAQLLPRAALGAPLGFGRATVKAYNNAVMHKIMIMQLLNHEIKEKHSVTQSVSGVWGLATGEVTWEVKERWGSTL